MLLSKNAQLFHYGSLTATLTPILVWQIEIPHICNSNLLAIVPFTGNKLNIHKSHIIIKYTSFSTKFDIFGLHD